MQTPFLIVFSQLFLMMLCTANAKPKVTTCIANYELNFFCDLKQFNDAKKVCNDGGSYLVKVDNANMTEIIKDVIDKINCPYREDYHAGATADNKRQWTWLDGDKVYLRNEGGYQNWRDGQPNDNGGREDCMILDKYTTKWIDSLCHGTPPEQRYYICQKNLTLTIEITELSHNILKCTVTNGSCVNHVKWLQNNKTVSTSQNHSVYQELAYGTSILYYQNATIKHGGEYSCVTWVIKNEQNKVEIYANIQINGTPTIEVIISSACNSSLVLYWRPNKHALGFPHRNVVHDSMSGKLTKEIIETPIKDVQQKTEIRDLQPFTMYHFQISACIDDESCTDEHTANTTATTLGFVIKNATMRQIYDNDTCIVTWNWSYDLLPVFKLKIISSVNASLVNRSANNTDKHLTFSFEMQPEQTYEVQIQANGSNEFCLQPVNVVGTCRGRDIPTATTKTTNQVTSENEETNTTNIIVPVVASSIVIILLTAVFAGYKMKIRTKQSDQPNAKPSTNKTNAAADYATVGDGETFAAYSTINDQPAVYVNYQQNSTYETVETNQHNISVIYETPISGK